MSVTGRDFVDHWNWAAEKGLLNGNTAGALRAACAKVLDVEKDWEKLDVTTIKIDDLVKRFRTLRGRDYKPYTLKEYERRFRKAHASYLDYVRDPSSWRAHVQERSTRAEKPSADRRQDSTDTSPDGHKQFSSPPPAGFVDYPFPLREGRIVRMSLPTDLRASEVKRLMAFLSTLVVDVEPEPAA